MEIVVHSKKSVSTRVSKETVPFQQEFTISECDVKNDPIRLPESESDKNIRLRLLVLLGIRLQLHPKTPDSLRLRLRLRNRGSRPTIPLTVS